jgi:hypothetical protein
MKLTTGIGAFVAIAAAALQPAFAQFHLPEPVFHKPVIQPEGKHSARFGEQVPLESKEFVMPAFDGLLWYLWDLAPVSLHEPDPLFSVMAAAGTAPGHTEQEIPANIRSNEFYVESQRLVILAQETYQYGDYDAAAAFARESIRYAQLSDEYIALQLKIKEANAAIAQAKQRLDQAASIGAARQNPAEYGKAETWYKASLNSRSGEEWDAAIDAAHKTVEALAGIKAVKGLPARYTVRSWGVSGDCLWSIAGQSWAYGDPLRWRVLYKANKSKLPDPNNPNLIVPGMVLDIPSIGGEDRQGLYTE